MELWFSERVLEAVFFFYLHRCFDGNHFINLVYELFLSSSEDMFQFYVICVRMFGVIEVRLSTRRLVGLLKCYWYGLIFYIRNFIGVE